MQTICAVHPKIARLIQDCLSQAGRASVSVQSSFSPNRTLENLWEHLNRQAYSLLVVDTALLPQKAYLDVLRQIRIAFPRLRIVLLSAQKQWLEENRISLGVLQIYDTLAYGTHKDGQTSLQTEFMDTLFHPQDASSFLGRTTFHNQKDHSQRTGLITAVAGLEPRSGTTKACLMLSMASLENTLLVELNADHPVLQEYFLTEEDYDASHGYYHLQAFPTLCVLPFSLSGNWHRHIPFFSSIILDLGVLPTIHTDARYVEFLRCERSILTSFCSPWNIQRLDEMNLSCKNTILWFNASTPEQEPALKKALGQKFRALVFAAHQPRWLYASKEQLDACRECLSIEKPR